LNAKNFGPFRQLLAELEAKNEKTPKNTLVRSWPGELACVEWRQVAQNVRSLCGKAGN